MPEGTGVIKYGAPFNPGTGGNDPRVPGSGDGSARMMVGRLNAQTTQFRAGQCSRTELEATIRMAAAIPSTTLSPAMSIELSRATIAARSALGWQAMEPLVISIASPGWGHTPPQAQPPSGDLFTRARVWWMVGIGAVLWFLFRGKV